MSTEGGPGLHTFNRAAARQGGLASMPAENVLRLAGHGGSVPVVLPAPICGRLIMAFKVVDETLAASATERSTA